MHILTDKILDLDPEKQALMFLRFLSIYGMILKPGAVVITGSCDPCYHHLFPVQWWVSFKGPSGFQCFCKAPLVGWHYTMQYIGGSLCLQRDANFSSWNFWKPYWLPLEHGTVAYPVQRMREEPFLRQSSLIPSYPWCKEVGLTRFYIFSACTKTSLSHYLFPSYSTQSLGTSHSGQTNPVPEATLRKLQYVTKHIPALPPDLGICCPDGVPQPEAVCACMFLSLVLHVLESWSSICAATAGTWPHLPIRHETAFLGKIVNLVLFWKKRFLRNTTWHPFGETGNIPLHA